MFISCNWAKNARGFRFKRRANFPFWAFVYLLKGKSQVETRDGVVSYEGPRLILAEPNIPYTLETLTPTHEIYAYFLPNPDMEPFMDWPRVLPGIRTLKYDTTKLTLPIPESVREMLQVANGRLPNRNLLAENILERILLLASNIDPNQLSAPLDERIKKAIDYIHKRLTEGVTVEAVARHAGLSISHFAHLFRMQVGKAPSSTCRSSACRRLRNFLSPRIILWRKSRNSAGLRISSISAVALKNSRESRRWNTGETRSPAPTPKKVLQGDSGKSAL